METPWAEEATAVQQAQGVGTEGLGADEAAARLARDGPNELQRMAPRRAWAIFVSQFRSIVMALLVAAAGVSAAFGDRLEAAAIAVLIVINAVLGFVMELRAHREMEALRDLARVETKVRRGGVVRSVPAEVLVVGDVLVLEGGDVVTADARVVVASNVEVDESTFTGESVPVAKQVAAVAPDAPLFARTCMLHKGTTLASGSVEAVVVATGPRTELGRISRLTQEARAETTPLEVRLGALGRRLIVVTLVLAALVVGIGILRGQDPRAMVKTGVALAVAAVPEGLPIVATLALARGMLRMAKRNAVVRRLSAVETLGSASVVCVDKTGTLTENHMALTEIWSPDVPREQVLEAVVLCNNAALDPPVGDPMEIALLEAALAAGMDVEAVRRGALRAREWAFHPTHRMMATQHEGRIVVKGAPEAVLAACSGTLEAAHAANGRMADQGLRVLAVAEGTHTGDPYRDLRFLGLVGLMDPPRADVPAAIQACHAAGILVCMVTGDQARTAARIAADVGIPPSPAMEGRAIPAASEPGASAALREVRLFSRVSPEQKLDIITAHQEVGRVVAMTGDGVNDAPALRKADIGVAMGRRGTAAAREAADVVLRDDAFPTIVEAIRLGRAIFTNIRRFAYYLLSCNVGEVAIIGLATLFGSTLPLVPLQILFLNFVTDVFPALALGFGEGDQEAMQRPPRPADEQILNRGHLGGILGYGVLFAAAVLGAFAVARGPMDLDDVGALTVSFTTLALAQLWHMLNMRDPGTLPWRNDVVRNPYAWGAVALSAGMVLLGMYVPALADLLTLRPLSGTEWGVVLAFSAVPLVVGQVLLTVRRPRTQS